MKQQMQRYGNFNDYMKAKEYQRLKDLGLIKDITFDTIKALN